MIEPALADLRQAAAGIAQSSPQIPIVSNLSGTWHAGRRTRPIGSTTPGTPSASPRYACALAEAGVTHFLEIGPHGVLARLGPACLASGQAAWLDSLRRGHDDDVQVLETLARLYGDGADVRWHSVVEPRSRVVLPTYPFQRSAAGLMECQTLPP